MIKDHLQFLSLPGYANSGPDHWQSWMETKLPNCIRIEQKSWDQPECNSWVENIQIAVEKNELSKTFIVAHSLGCIAVAHWARIHKHNIAGVMLVCPPDIENPYAELGLESFLPIPLETLPFPSLVVGSTNDHWATVTRITHFSSHWGSGLIWVENAGHINPGSGFGPWEQGLNFLEVFINNLG